jgi:diaminohydroxyphosphoribosylaminopyrimidine deaminase/5-amino-6-(5-phosphoribosylamino)uracil reductase
MQIALRLARRGLGRVWPNPAVGCVIVSDGRIVGRGWTQPGGRPHAETEALARAGGRARGATAYVTLEPCAHHGVTPPCAGALIDAGIKRAVVAAGDPDPRVDGGGLRILAEAGIEVVTDVCREEGEAINAGFFRRIRDGRPYVTLKTATTLDGRIATRTGDSRWITGEEARQAGHLLRASHDAILIGAGTAVQDNPTLTCRLPGLADRSPVRVVLDGHMRLPLTHALVATARATATWLVVLADAASDQTDRRKAYEAAGVAMLPVDPDDDGNPDIAKVLGLLAAKGITRLLVEGGGRVAAAFLAARRIDEIVWFRAPCIIGGDGLPALAAFGVERLSEAVRATGLGAQTLGPDVVERYILRG